MSAIPLRPWPKKANPGILLRMGKSKKTGIGSKKHPLECICSGCATVPVKSKIRWDGSPKPRKQMRRVSKKRCKETQVLKLMRRLICQEYAEAMDGDIEQFGRLELDHIHGRTEQGFVFGALLTPTNLQMITHQEHYDKTNGENGVSQRQDFRPKSVQLRLVALTLRLEKKVGPVWDLLDLKNAVESEIYAE